MRFCGDGTKWGIHIQYSPEPHLWGTAGALRPWRTFFDGPFLVVYGDNLTKCDYRRLLEVHRTRAAEVTVALFWREDTSQSGIAELDADGWVTKFIEKPSPDQASSHWVNAGVLVLEPALIDTISADGTPDFGRDLLPRWALEHRRVFGYRMTTKERLWWIDTPSDLARVKSEIQQHGM
jgi:mannose-1-phosphate guanylyltransferase